MSDEQKPHDEHGHEAGHGPDDHAAVPAAEPHGHADHEPDAPVAAIPQIAELNIGHFLIGEAIFTGLGPAIQRMRALMDEARATKAA